MNTNDELIEIVANIFYINRHLGNEDARLSKNRLKQVVYLFYIVKDSITEMESLEFLDETRILLNNHVISITDLDDSVDILVSNNCLKREGNDLLIGESFSEFPIVISINADEDTESKEKYNKYKNFFISVLSYKSEAIFQLVFHEPTFENAILRNAKEIDYHKSILVKQIKAYNKKYKKEIKDNNMNIYDIISNWIDFTLSKKEL